MVIGGINAGENEMDGVTMRQEVLKGIIDIEEEMFKGVKPLEESECLQRLKAFRQMREMSFSAWGLNTLCSYYTDLCTAQEDGRNLIIEKYARMDNLLPVINDNPLIGEIAHAEYRWMQELAEKYPHAIHVDKGFDTYIRGELETYSDMTLELYYEDIKTALSIGMNLNEQRYLHLYTSIGYKSLEEVEEKAKSKAEGKAE